MQINYVLMAVLASFYWFCSIYTLLRKRSTLTLLNRIILSAEYSIRIALDTAIVFNLAFLLAAICSSARALSSRTRVNVYSSQIANFVAVWSVLPILVLQHSASDSLRRTKSRATVYCLMAILLVANFSLWAIIYKSPRTYDSGVILQYDVEFQTYFNDLCIPPKAYHGVWTVTMFMAIYELISVLMIVIPTWPRLLPTRIFRLDCCISALPNFSQNKKLFILYYSRSQSTANVFNMWVFFWQLVQFHQDLLAQAGSSNKELELSFGQILSLATWLPVLVEFGYIFFKGPKEALTGQMVKPYRAETHEPVDSHQIRHEEDTDQEVMAGAEFTKAESSEELWVPTQKSRRDIETSTDQSLLGRDIQGRAKTC